MILQKTPYRSVWILFITLHFSSAVNGQDHIYIYNDSLVQQKPKAKSIFVPVAFVTYGFIAPDVNLFHKLDFNTNHELREDHPVFKSTLDDYLRYAPVVAVYGMNLAGVKGKHNFMDRTAILLLADLILAPSVGLTKNLSDRTRPYGGDHSFPSGHTAMAFMTAEFMHQEYKDDYPLYSLLGYTAATAVSILRVYNGAHWVSDVVAGAGYGIISTKLSYMLYPVIKKMIFQKESIRAMLTPVHRDGYTGFIFIQQF